MKKLMICIAAMLLVTFTPIQSNAENNPTSTTSATEKEKAEVKALIDRVNEINAMDRSTMSPSERKEIRKELRAIKKEVNHRHRHSGGTVYISGGFLVLIIVLIIIF